MVLKRVFFFSDHLGKKLTIGKPGGTSDVFDQSSAVIDHLSSVFIIYNCRVLRDVKRSSNNLFIF